MLIFWILYATAVAAALAAVASIADRLAASRSWPRRWIWAGSIAMGLLLPLGTWVATEPTTRSDAGLGDAVVVSDRGAGPEAASAAPSPLVEIATAARSLLAPVDRRIRIGWPLASLALLLLYGGASWRLARARRGWRLRRLDGRNVLVSPATGPAVVGVLKPAIVLPEWATRAEPPHLTWMLRHEVEHLRAQDARLVTALAFAVALAPWNAVLWWQLRRLRLAVELDCDARVLRGAGRSERRDYGRLLLSVGRRPAGPRLAAAFAERPSNLERRIRTMSDRPRPVSRSRALALTGLMGLLLVAALTLPGPAKAPAEPEPPPNADAAEMELIELPPEIEIPPTPEGDADADAAADDELDADGWEPEPPPELRDEPVFTPFEVAPKLLNGSEVEAALASEYPPLLRDAGIGGKVMVLLLIDEHGRVHNARVDGSSGHEALDEAALEVAEVMEFAPAQNRDTPVPVWISLPITFQVR